MKLKDDEIRILRIVKRHQNPSIQNWAKVQDVVKAIVRETGKGLFTAYNKITELSYKGFLEKSKSPVAKISIVRLTPSGEEFLASLSTSPEGKGDAPISTPQVQTAPVSKPSGAHSPSSTSPEGEPAEPPSPPATAPSHGGGDEAGNAKEVDSHA